MSRLGRRHAAGVAPGSAGHPPLIAVMIITSSVAATGAPSSRTCSRLTKILMCVRIASCSSIVRKRMPG